MADLKISALNALSGADLVAADVVAVVDDSASETKKLTVSDLIANGTTLISDNTIPSAKILFAAGTIDYAELAESAVRTSKINDSAVTAAKLADNSSVTLVSTLPASGAFTGQIALDTDDDKIYVWDGSAWDSVKGAGSINVVNGSTTGEINIVASTSGDTVTISATLDNTTAAAQFLGGPTGAAGAVGYRALVGSDLPTATTTTKGGIIVNGEGLRMDLDTIEIANDVTANSSTYQAVQFNSKGLITAGRDITAADLPEATAGAIGGVKPGSGLTMGSAGAINHTNAVTGATNTKITFDAQGHVTAGTNLSASDIPDLDTAKVTTGTFPTERIADEAVTGDKLANYAVAQISETTPTAEFTSQFFFNPITRDLFLWDGNVFQPVGISAGEIVLAGTYDASTNLLDSVTADGSAAGFTNGASLPAADTGNNRYYVVVSQSGTGSAPAPTVALEPPDIILSNGTSYVLIETSETITAQIASNVGFTPTGNIAGTNVQAALSEVDSEKVAKAGDTMTGDLTLNNADVVFEGATENDYETTLTVTDPTADRTITLPDVTGTVVTTGDTGSVTSTMITDGTIVNADINASAEIAVSKLANGTARQLLQTDAAGTGVEFTSNVDVPGTFDVAGAGTFDTTLTVTGVISADGKVKFPAGTAAAPSFYSGTDTDTGLYFSAADEVSVATGGTQRVVVDSDGKVGVGVSSPLAKIHSFAGSSSVTPNASADELFLENNGNVGLQFGCPNTGNARISFGDPQDAQSGLIFYDHATDYLRFDTAATERMRIDSSGNVGVGTSSPSSLLHISGSSAGMLRTDRSTDERNHYALATLGTIRGYIGATSSNCFEISDNGGASKVTVTNGGNVGIGTTSPGAELDVNGKVIVQSALGVGGANFGTAGQVLVSNGSSAAPSWEQITPSAVFGWDHDDDTYGLYLPGTSIKVSDLTGTVDIDVQSRIRRCVINDSGVVQYYLDADDSDLKSGDWLRIVETEALDTAYTGTISESTNSLLRVGVPAWAAGTFTLGQRVTHSGSLWECIAATTTATPAAGTVSSVLDGTDGQVVVEVPAFSVRYGFLNGVHTREVRLGCSDSLIAQGFQPHPAFIKTDGSYKDAFYIGAYHTYDDAGTGSSVSGQTNTRSQTRATFRTEAEARGTGWHVLSYLELAAIQTLLVCEFQDYNSQKVIGNGSDAGTTYGVTTGQSDGDGNHSVNSTDNVSDADDYMAYRGIENLYGRAWQFVDGINVYERVVYLSNDQTAFADDTADGYEFYAQVPTGSSSYQKELHPLADVFLPSVVTGSSATTYLGDAFWSSTGWRVALVGGSSSNGSLVGAFCLGLYIASGSSYTNLGSRLAYAAN